MLQLSSCFHRRRFNRRDFHCPFRRPPSSILVLSLEAVAVSPFAFVSTVQIKRIFVNLDPDSFIRIVILSVPSATRANYLVNRFRSTLRWNGLARQLQHF